MTAMRKKWKYRLWIPVVALGLMNILAMKPARKGRVSMDVIQEYDYAHRGLYNVREGIAENTLPAFQRAVDKNCGIELDIHLTRDGELVVFHDDNLVRACDSGLKVDESTLKELQSHTLFDTDQTMPLFSEVLSLVDGKVPLLIELKTDNNVMSKRYMKVCQKLKEELEGYNGTYAIQSFDPRVLWWFRQNCPEVPRGQLMEHFRRHGTKVVPIYDFFASHLLFNFITQPDFISYQYMDRDRLAFRVIKGLYGVQEFSWTVRDEELADFLKKEGSLVIFEGYNNKLDEEE